MRFNIKTAIAFFLLCAALCPSPAFCGEQWQVEPGRGIGWIMLGENIQKIIDFYGGTRLKMGELYWYKEEGLEFYAPGQHVEEIIIVKPSFKDLTYSLTSGLSVGSSPGDVQKEFGAAEKAIYSKGVYALNYFERGISFYIRDDAVCKILIYKRLGGSQAGDK